MAEPPPGRFSLARPSSRTAALCSIAPSFLRSRITWPAGAVRSPSNANSVSVTFRYVGAEAPLVAPADAPSSVTMAATATAPMMATITTTIAASAITTRLPIGDPFESVDCESGAGGGTVSVTVMT